MVQVEEGYILVNFSKSVYIVCSVATDTKDYTKFRQKTYFDQPLTGLLLYYVSLSCALLFLFECC